MKIIADKEKPGTFVADFIYHGKREERSSQRREKGDHRTRIPTGAPAPACGQDDEEERVSKIRRVLSRTASGCVRQLTNMRATAKQRGCRRRRRDRYCAFVLLIISLSGGTTLCVES